MWIINVNYTPDGYTKKSRLFAQTGFFVLIHSISDLNLQF